MKLIFDFSQNEIIDWLTSQKESRFRGNQIWVGIYNNCYNHPDEFTTLPSGLRERLAQNFVFQPMSSLASLKSKDGFTEKQLFSFQDGAMIETVLMRYNNRNTLCISTQSGCAMGCVFCATGQMGFTRNLTSGEIIAQVLFFQRLLKPQKEALTNIVLMGMGEPFQNYDASLTAINRLNDPDGLNMGARRFTISTVGIVPKILQFADENVQVNLAISLHAATDELRSNLLPINRIYPISRVIEACKYYIEKTNRRITFEYALIDGVNDSEAHARNLVNLIRGLLCHVNLIALNPTQGYKYLGSSSKVVEAFQQILETKNIQTTVRLRRGIEIQAGCGQLAYQNPPMI